MPSFVASHPAQASAWAAILRHSLLVIFGASFIAVCSQISVLLPFTPVPFTAQTLSVLLVGVLLGSRRGTGAVLLYLAEGISGAPVFQGGHSGLLYALGPTGGYLAGFVLAAGIAGYLCERGWAVSRLRLAAALATGSLAVYIPGVAWLSLAGSLPLHTAIVLGALPFLPLDLAKAVLAGSVLASGRSALRSFGL